MERFRATFFAAASLVPAVFTISALQGAHLAADSSRGARLLETLSCLQCHRVNGRGRAVASDLGWRIGRDFTPATLAAAMWNHAPLMWAAMREQSIVPVDLDEQAAADLFAYFYSVRFFEKPGDAERGKAAFGSKGCSKCHGFVQAKRSAAKPVSQWESVSEPIALASAMWNHGAAMAGDFDKLKLKWPQLTSQDITDLVIYLQGQQAGRHVSGLLETTSGVEGEALFHTKGCANCHTERLSLAERLKGKTLTDIAAAMWNHKPRMAATAPELTAAEMREIAGYLWATGFFEDSGDATAGRRVFSAKHCAACHNDAQKAAPKLNGKAFSGITMLSALWHHGSQMLEEMVASPTFARPRRFSPEQNRKHWSACDYRLHERKPKSTVFSGIRTDTEGWIPLVIAVRAPDRGAKPPPNRHDGFLTKLAEDAIIGRSDKDCEPFAATLLVLSCSNQKARE